MDKDTIKNLLTKYEGSLDPIKFLDSILILRKHDTCGELWESIRKSDCNKCPFKENCDIIYETLNTIGIELYCNQIVDILLGDKTIDSFLN